ncbi:sulfate permease [Nocardioides marmoriginsengisoli]|uniref:Sulfate permease n=1 Tax=Nocardioides marmoriginsengisoli TaxID=661483 RepID=A0A3N0CHR9_9ACTN|nr:sulfate permease [Nocardioides marmoriginsengisoli]RNL62821.1 sulfate permease [Nocardioides marmoriginsengisoli]
MLTLMWNVSAAIRGYTRFYMPTNIAIDLLRTRRGLKWAVPVAVVAVPVYLFVMSLCDTLVNEGGPGWLNVLVILFFWNAIKFGWMAVLSPCMLVRAACR